MSAAKPLVDELDRFMALINRICGSRFNGVLVNRYNGGSDYISPHSDEESGLSPDVGVVAVSLGAVRTMNFKEKKAPFTTHNFTMPDGSALCMNGAHFQREYTHGIRPQKLPAQFFQSKEARRRTQTRISLTFRCHHRTK
jgi:alkylated DNA repair dioxygenase AlkB